MYEYQAKLIRVIDGDTVVLDLDLGLKVHVVETVRILGIDTPEIFGVKKESEEYKKGILAKEYLESLLTNKNLVVKTYKDKTEKYGRYLADIFVDESSVAFLLLEAGLAEPYV